MNRIGLAASKIAKGNIWLYHLAVIAISFLFAAFVFLVCGFSIAVAIFLISLIVQLFIPKDPQIWIDVFKTCLGFLAALVGVVTLVAIVHNIKMKNKL